MCEVRQTLMEEFIGVGGEGVGYPKIGHLHFREKLALMYSVVASFVETFWKIKLSMAL